MHELNVSTAVELTVLAQLESNLLQVGKKEREGKKERGRSKSNELHRHAEIFIG